MTTRRVPLAVLAVFGFTMVWGTFYHLVLLRGADQAMVHLYRPDLSGRMWLSVFGVLGISAFFVAGYRLAAKRGTLLEGLAYGVCFSILAGLLVDLNQYVLYPVPGVLALKWYAGGLVEFAVNGVLVSLIHPCRRSSAPCAGACGEDALGEGSKR